MATKKEVLIVNKDITAMDKFVDAVSSIPMSADLIYSYVCIQVPPNRYNVRIDEIYADGYVSEGVFYTFTHTPFLPVNPVDYPAIKVMEEKVIASKEEGKKKKASLKLVPKIN